MSISGDQVLQGLTGTLRERMGQRAVQQQRAAEQAQRLQEILLKEKLTRERDEIKRRAAVNTERGTKEKVNSRVKASERNALLAAALGSPNDLSTAYGTRPSARHTRVSGYTPTAFDDPREQFIRPTISQTRALNPALESKVANILMGTQSQQFKAANEFRTSGGEWIIDPTARVKREQNITKENTRLAQEDAKYLQEENKARHKEEISLIDSEIASLKLEKNNRKNITPEASLKIQKLLAKKRKLVLLGPQSHSAEGLPDPRKQTNKIGRFEVVE